MAPRSPLRFPPDHDDIALVLQGGGALGAYQAGVYAEIFRTEFQPNWVAGVSIGSINAGFYEPWVPPPFLQRAGTPAALSFYDTSALRKTLLDLVSFKLVNDGPVRLSVGAVNVRSGNSQWFDNRGANAEEITVDHILASGALPPAFAPVVIGKEAYWDGGIVSNTPLQYVLDERATSEPLLVFQVDLFSARGPIPEDLSEALQGQARQWRAALQKLDRAAAASAPTTMPR